MSRETEMNKFIDILLKRPNSEHCPIRNTLEMLSGKWRTQVIYELCKKDSYRFNELKTKIPKITNTMLTTTLRDLENKGIVHREQYNEIPPHVEYSLTKKGKDLLPVFYEIAQWSDKYEDN